LSFHNPQNIIIIVVWLWLFPRLFVWKAAAAAAAVMTTTTTNKAATQNVD